MTEARPLRGQGQGHDFLSSSRHRGRDDSRRGPHPWMEVAVQERKPGCRGVVSSWTDRTSSKLKG